MNIIKTILSYIGAIVRGKVTNKKNAAKTELKINIETSTTYIICKAWEWHETSEANIQDLREDLLLLKAIAKRDRKKALFGSKYPLPHDLKKWLILNEIPFKEN